MTRLSLQIYNEQVELTESQLEQLADNELKTETLQDGDYYMNVFVEGARQLAMKGGRRLVIAKCLDVVNKKLPPFVE